mmetsp:Transcript_31043/g.89715  ORF Transcript_31043/g.89715 Transcript_31043/m.89715 type:complete len:186 (-) Transcript_31043:182-739(-)
MDVGRKQSSLGPPLQSGTLSALQAATEDAAPSLQAATIGFSPPPSALRRSATETAAEAASGAPMAPAAGKKKRKAATATTEQQTRKDAVAAFWAQQLPHATAPAAGRAVAAKEGRRARTRSRSRAQALLSIPRDLSVSPISEPGVLKKRRKKKQPERQVALELRKAGSKTVEEKRKRKASGRRDL